MPITPVQILPEDSLKKRSPLPKITGYCALATGIASGIAGNRKKIKLHKTLAYFAGVLSLAHLGIIEFLHHKKSSVSKQ